MGIFDFLKQEDSLLAVDIGATAVRLMELDLDDDTPRLVNVGLAPLSGDVFSNHVLSKPEVVVEGINQLLEANAISDKRAVVAVPGPAVFTKRVKLPKADVAEIRANLQYEAANFIPHSIDAVKLDFHIIGEADKNQLDVLVVAVKDEIIESFVDCLAMAGLETAVVDVDYFALQNMFEMVHPELIQKTVALVNMGARYSGINICRGGHSLFTGDISVGGRSLTEEIASQLGVSFEEAERLKVMKRDTQSEGPQQEQVHAIVDRNVEWVASEFNRQLSFFWNASGAEEGIDHIYLTGGNALLPGLLEELSEKTGIHCAYVNSMAAVDWGESFEESYIHQMAPLMGISVGLGIREIGDRIIPDYE